MKGLAKKFALENPDLTGKRARGTNLRPQVYDNSSCANAIESRPSRVWSSSEHYVNYFFKSTCGDMGSHAVLLAIPGFGGP
jgi:hypothetical protein